MKIRKAKKNELKQITKIMLKEFSKPPFNEKVDFNFALKSLKFYFELGEIYVVSIDKNIVGATVFKVEQYWEGKVLIIEDLVVKKEFKEQGVGKNLMKFIEDYAKKKSIRRILFITDKRLKAINFYRKLNYKEEKDRINMTKKLK